MKILVTGAAGFIGYHLCNFLLSRGDTIVGIDNLNDYYSVELKLDRLKLLDEHPNSSNFQFLKIDLADQPAMEGLFNKHAFHRVCHLGAQAGVRYSIENPRSYIQSNVVGFTNVLEECRHHNIEHLVYASSSSVYGANTQQPFSETHNVDHPKSLYAATKKSNELMAHTYSSLFDLPTTGLRFFTVYGPWGRPDMAPILFANGITHNKEIKVFNHGEMQRDFTYIDDIVDGIVRAIDNIATADPDWNSADPSPKSSYAPYRVYNIGNNAPVKLLDFIETLENAFGKTASKKYMDMQDGDVSSTYADTTALQTDTGFTSKTPLENGVKAFANWYKSYYQ